MEMKRGTLFQHKHWLNPADGSPMVGVVTRVAQGVIYWRPHYGKHDDGTDWLGAPAYFPKEQTGRYVSKILPAHSTREDS